MQYLIELSDYDREQMELLQKLQDGIKEDQEEVKDQKEEVQELLDAQNDQKDILDEMLIVKADALREAKDAKAIEEEKNAYIASALEEQKEEVERLIEEYNKTHPIPGGGGGDGGDLIWTGGQFLWPLPSPYGSNWITSRFGYRGDPFGGGYTDFHGGLDIGAPCNTPIYAVLDGTVILSQDGWNGGCGNYTVIYHGGGLYTEYMHQNVRAVSAGDTVTQGQIIGYVGTTGSSTGYHLHLGVVLSANGFNTAGRVDPAPYLGL